MKDTQPVRVRIGVFELDLRSGELRAADKKKTVLQEQQLQVLRMLVEREGKLVSREAIKQRLWPNDTIVDFDHSINAAIKNLRRALGDSADDPKYIETLARRGYRLIVPVDCVSADDSSGEVSGGAGGTAVRMQPEPGLIGKKVSHYRVLQVIGAGGMGLVYKAEDLKLGRPVALKFLPEELATNAAALQRFEREAQTASSLNHRNICTIYEVEEHETKPFIVMELLEGRTLREWLASAHSQEKALPLKQLLEVATQVANGLQAAHDKGIVHRDIKPANIFLTTSGQVKILDFGVAKLATAVEAAAVSEAAALPEDQLDRKAEDANLAATPLAATEHSLTRTGTAMGTAGYMSPEQVRGEKLDARTDIFSFGLVLYEMFTGHRAFSGDTAEKVHEAILRQPQIPVHDLNSRLAPELEIIINRALEKDRELRYQSAGEMSADLRRLHRSVESSMQKPRWYGPVLLLGGAVLLIVLIALSWWLKFRGLQNAPVKTLSERQLTHNPSENRVLGAAISPDGKYLAYVDPKGLRLSVIETGETHEIALPENLRTQLSEVTWFPDGEKLLFTAGSDAEGHTIWAISVFGGNPRRLGGGSNWAGPVISPRGSWIAFISGNGDEIWLMGPDGENPHKILSGMNERYAAVAWSPTGQRLAYLRAGKGPWGGSVETISLEGGVASEVISDSRIANNPGPYLLWANDGHIIFVSYEVGPLRGQNLWEIMTDPVSGKPSEAATKLTNWDGLSTYSPTLSKDANLLAVLKLHIRADVYVGDLEDGGTRLASPRRLTVSDSVDQVSGWMLDGKTILFSSDRVGRRQILRQGIDQDAAEPLITGPDYERDAELSPDGRWILYWSISHPAESSKSTRRLMRLPVSGGGPEQVLEVKTGDYDYFDCPVRPDGSCVFIHWEAGQSIFYALDPLQGRGNELARTKFGSTVGLYWSVSPEGSRIAVGGRGHNGEGQVRILNFRNGAEHNLMLPQGWRLLSLSWTADGNALFATALSTGYLIARIDLDGQTHVLLDRGVTQGLGYICPSPDGHHLAFSQETRESNAWLLENF